MAKKKPEYVWTVELGANGGPLNPPDESGDWELFGFSVDPEVVGEFCVIAVWRRKRE